MARPELFSETVLPQNVYGEKDRYGRGDAVTYDFGDHQVGYITFDVNVVGSHQDAPAFLAVKFGEVEEELKESLEEYHGLSCMELYTDIFFA